LVVEDEPHTRRALRAVLVEDGYKVLEAGTGGEGLIQTFERHPSVILLDLGLPDVDGLEVTRHIRESSRVPIIVVSARGEEDQQVEALDSGANDYVTKPFRAAELLARVRVALRWGAFTKEPAAPFQLRDLLVDFVERRVFLGETEVVLTLTEFKLLAAMIGQAGKVMTHQQLLREVWGPAYVKEVQYLRVYMRQLRQKLEKDPAQPKYLLTAPGVGYRLKVDT
jgi:two-component system KDP operon response regulator KdpE